MQHAKSGKLRALAVSSKLRNPMVPDMDVPTIAQSGYPVFEAMCWSGLSARTGTPQAVVDRLEAALAFAMQSPAVRQRMESVGLVVPPQGSKAHTQLVKSEIDGRTRVIQLAGIKPE